MSKQRAITFLGVTHALGGDALSVGEPAPDFRLWYFNKGEGGGAEERGRASAEPETKKKKLNPDPDPLSLTLLPPARWNPRRFCASTWSWN